MIYVKGAYMCIPVQYLGDKQVINTSTTSIYTNMNSVHKLQCIILSINAYVWACTSMQPINVFGCVDFSQSVDGFGCEDFNQSLHDYV